MDIIDISSFTEEEAKQKAKAAAPVIEPAALEENPEPVKMEIPEPGINLAPQIVTAPGVIETQKAEPLKPEPEEMTAEEARKLAEKNASMLVNVTDLLVSRLCSLLSGEDHERYKLHKLEKEEYKEAAAAYFESVKTKVSPALIFFTSTFTIFSGILFKAWGDRQRKIKDSDQKKKIEETAATLERERQAAREAAPKVPEATGERPQEKLKETNKEVRKVARIYKEEVPEAMESRSNFEIFTKDDKPAGVSTKWNDKVIGYYKRSAENARLTYEEVLKEGTKPSPLLSRLILADIEKQKPWRIINKELRHYIKKLPSFED